MNQFYTLVEATINVGSFQTFNDLVDKLNQNPGEHSQQYGCGLNIFYVLKRLVCASLARDLNIKQNAYNALKILFAQVADVLSVSKTSFQDFFFATTNLTECKTKQQKNAYLLGKINIVKSLPDLFKGSKQIITHFVELANQNQSLQEEFIEAIYILVGGQIKRYKLNLIPGTNSHVLFDILSKKQIKTETINLAIETAIQYYPKQSITLNYLGLNLADILTSPQQFFTSEYTPFIQSNSQSTGDGNLKRLYYLLQIQKHFLDSIIIGPSNIHKFLSSEMIVAWLQELRVKNKQMRKLAESINIKFQEEPQFTFEVLKFLHQKNIYLENISQNHPFAKLYKNVQKAKLWSYLIEQIHKAQKSLQFFKQSNQMLEQQVEKQLSKKQEFLSELEYITREGMAELASDQIGETLTILIKAYQKSQRSEKLLNLVWSLFSDVLNSNLKRKSRKKIILNLRGPLILSKIKFSELELQNQIIQTLANTTKFLRIKVKVQKQKSEQDKNMVAFLNFITGLMIYCIVYPEEVDVCGQIEFLYKDLQFIFNKKRDLPIVEVVDKKQKKLTKQQPQDLNKPVHILVDIFISLLTKAPLFLRNSTNLLFEQLVPFIGRSDLENLLEVIQKPDQQYIEEI